LQNLAKDTQGIFAHAQTSSEITSRFQEIQSQIHGLWVVDVAVEAMAAGANPQLKVSWQGQTQTTALSLDAAWKGAEFEPEEVVEEPSKTPIALIVGGISAVILIGGGFFINKKNEAQREEDRMASEQAARSAQQAADRAMDEAKKAQAQFVEAKEEAVAEKARAAQKTEKATAEKAQAAAAAPSNETPAPRKTMFRSPGGAGVAHLLLENGSTLPIFSGLGAARVRIGGDPDRVDVVLEHETVSGHHANLTRSDTGAIYLEDAGSSNGTYVNNHDIRGQGPMLIQPGQAIQFGLLKTSLGA
jgi:flagellar biosynthesis GTPase FlhF